VIVMVAGTILWNLASAAGTIGSVESFFKEIGVLDTFNFQGGTIFRATFLAGLILVIAGSAFNVLLSVLFNLISDLVGGIRFTVIEEETARPMASELVPPRR
jgi:ABC-type antimicrobial peptide transport system permease subunit